MENEWGQYRRKIIGMGEKSAKKSYYPQLQKTIEELKISRDSFQSILNNANDSILLHDIDGNVLLMNDRTHQTFDIPKDYTATISINNISSPKNDLSKLGDIWSKVMDGQPMEFEWIARKYNSDDEFIVWVTLNRTDWMGTTCIVAVVRDISDRKKYEHELIEAKSKAEESDKLKSAFLANMSHEIRTPMNSILGFTELLQIDTINEETKQRYLNIIHENGNRLLSIINDLINISIIEAGRITLNYESVDVNEVLIKLINSFIPEANRKHIDLIIHSKDQTNNLKIRTDKTRLSQVLSNLINNALKFTETGSITIGYKQQQPNEIVFFVKDTGKGIPKKLHKKIFDRFHKSNPTLDKAIEGTGLGLSISKAYINLLGGKIWVESTPKEGSCFFFTHPV